MSAPVRVQRQRSPGWRMPPNTVYVGRGSVFGNLTVCTPQMCRRRDPEEERCCVDNFAEYLASGLEGRTDRVGSLRYGVDHLRGYPRRAAMVKALPRLRGKNLACWCPLDQPCHADVLLEIANAPVCEEITT